MKRGFTIIELLVASALLGMLVTILTMIFNQSSIAWRIGTASVANFKTVRSTFGTVKDELDNVIVLPQSANKAYRIVGLWDAQNQLRKRAVNTGGVEGDNGGDSQLRYVTGSQLSGKTLMTLDRAYNVGQGSGGGSYSTYMVNVKSGGPKNDITRYDAIWSSPDDTSDW